MVAVTLWRFPVAEVGAWSSPGAPKGGLHCESMEEALKVGSVVALRSGGPKMTVMNVVNEQVHCIWFPYLESGFAREPTEQWFPTNCLLSETAEQGKDGSSAKKAGSDR